MVVNAGTDDERVIQERLGYWGPVVADAVISARSGGGGGWGDPRGREPQRVADDVRNGYVTAGGATEIYGVALRANGDVDEPETSRLRDQR